MPDPRHIPSEVLFHPNFDIHIRDLVKEWRFHTYVDILVVVDTEISISPANTFGVSQVIDLIRGTAIGCMRFRVDIALRDQSAQSVNPAPTATQPKYTGFRFDMAVGGAPVIDKYEQIWCFGFKPSNSGSTNDAEIDQAFAMPASDPELNALDAWMTARKGGLFGTGDHHFLGASMCRKIPRLGTMRRWTNADGVPPIGTPARIDTLRPPSAQYEPGANPQLSLGNGPHQGDLTVQPIQWVADAWHFHKFLTIHKRPHPVLCHPTLGPINVMPDHAHEGWCVESPDLTANKKFKAELEYPDATDGGPKPAPKVIAYGSNLGQPPYRFDKGDQPARNHNPMIAVYDGHRAGVGRVATDSTWHHWMDVNINAIKAANTLDWQKISRYYQNLAVWLCPPGYSTHCFWHSVIASHFDVIGWQEYSPATSLLDHGTALRHHLRHHYGPCWVTRVIFEVLVDLELVRRFPPIPPEEWDPRVRFDGELLEVLVLGHMVAATTEPIEAIKRGETRKLAPLAPPEKLFAKPLRAALSQFVELSQGRAKEQLELLGMALH